MIAELGLLSLIISFSFACLLVVIPTWGLYWRKPHWVSMAPSLVYLQCGFLAVSFLALAICFIQNDFSLIYVVSNSSKNLPLFYKICAIWGGHEGSILLWAFLLSLWTLAVVMYGQQLDLAFKTRVLVILGALSVGFLLFIIAASNPFKLNFAYENSQGRDLNPLLQDPGFLLHPPMLYMGYVGFSVAFAFAIAALWMGKVEGAWAKWSRPWTLAAWSLLTLGITLGSWWAYRELGWGGWWFWDPVENASFMPWLIGTALIHSLAVSEKRKQFYVSTLLLSIMAFSMSLVGTFLVRSGVLTSVHAFAVDPMRGLYILAFLGLVIGGSLLLFALRAPALKITGYFDPCSRESFLLMNNLLMTICMFTVLLGTLYPLIIDGLGLGKLSVGAPYFNMVFIPLFTPVLFLMGLAFQAKWQRENIIDLINKTKLSLLLSVLISISFFIVYFKAKLFMATLGVFLAAWVLINAGLSLKNKLKTQRLSQLSSSYWGMCLAHMGIAITVLGISISSGLGIQKDVKLKPHESISLGGYTLTYMKEFKSLGPNYQAIVAKVKVERGSYVKWIYPEKRIYTVAQTAMTDSAIDVNPFRDIYVALGESYKDNAWSFRLYHKPFIRWIWAGGVLIFLGGILALSDRRYYRATKTNEIGEEAV